LSGGKVGGYAPRVCRCWWRREVAERAVLLRRLEARWRQVAGLNEAVGVVRREGLASDLALSAQPPISISVRFPVGPFKLGVGPSAAFSPRANSTFPAMRKPGRHARRA
jgi:hypothetical protein